MQKPIYKQKSFWQIFVSPIISVFIMCQLESNLIYLWAILLVFWAIFSFIWSIITLIILNRQGKSSTGIFIFILDTLLSTVSCFTVWYVLLDSWKNLSI